MSHKTMGAKIVAEFALVCLILAVIGVLMQDKMNSLLNSLTEQAIARQTADFSLLAEERFNSELSELAMAAKFLEHNPNNPGDTIRITLGDQPGIHCGLISRTSGAVAGTNARTGDFKQLRYAFAGRRVIDYCAGQGLLFAVPVYNGDNVRYVLFRLYDENLLTKKFGLSEYDSHSRILIRERGGRIIVPYADFSLEDKYFYFDEDIQAGFNEVRKKLSSSKSAAVYTESKRGKYFLFGADLPRTNCSMIGYIPWEVSAGGVSRIYNLVLTVVTLLLLLFAVAGVYMFLAQARAAESDVLRRSVEMAKHASEAKSKFLASMSHEIRTPINAVLGMNELILRESKEKNITGYAHNISSAGQALLAIINDILDFSKIESGRMELAPAPYNLSSLLFDTITIIEPRARKKGLSFHVEVDEILPAGLWGDVTRIRQIILNLLTNAVKYTPQGDVTLAVKFVLTSSDEVLLEFAVSDTGIGIREEDKDKLFADFSRFDAVKNSGIEGTGLGLAITKQLIELMNGTVEVTSVYGQGSTFCVRLPQKIVDSTPIGDFSARVSQSNCKDVYHDNFTAPTAKILLVDDNEMNLLVAQGLLKETKIAITSVKSGQECLEEMVKEHYDVILLDQMMPGMDGPETLAKSRGLAGNKCENVPVIALTANAVQGAREMFLTAGFTDYLSKPVSGKKLTQTIRKYLPPEKITPVTGTENITPPQTAQKLEQVQQEAEPLIDREAGLEYSSGMEELYKQLLAKFCNMKAEKKAELEREFAAKDWNNYTIHVHALKSTARTLGGNSLAEAAKKLEMAGRTIRDAETSKEDKEESLAYILAHHAAAMELYDKTTEFIQENIG